MVLAPDSAIDSGVAASSRDRQPHRAIVDDESHEAEQLGPNAMPKK